MAGALPNGVAAAEQGLPHAVLDAGGAIPVVVLPEPLPGPPSLEEEEDEIPVIVPRTLPTAEPDPDNPFAEQAVSWVLIRQEILPEQDRPLRILLAPLDAPTRAAVYRVTDNLAVGRRGIFVDLLLDDRPGGGMELVDFLTGLSPQQAQQFAQMLNVRKPDLWRAVPEYLAVAGPDALHFALFAPNEEWRCRVERPGDRWIPAPGPQLPVCTNEQERFYNLWQDRYKRLIRGIDAPAGATPWQAQILRAGQSAQSYLTPRQRSIDLRDFGKPVPSWQHNHVCGAAYIGGRWAITAAHCIGDWRGRESLFFDGRRIRLGSDTINDGGQIFEIDAVVRHKRYRRARDGNDIALLRLTKKPTGRGINQVTLPPSVSMRFPSGTEARVTGWGLTGETLNTSDVRDRFGQPQYFSAILQQADLTLRVSSECNFNPNFRERGLTVGVGQLCAGAPGGVDSCKGDSGGPLVTRKGGITYLVGLVSFGPGCGLRDTPGVYTDVTHFVGWIAGAKKQAVKGEIVDW